LAITLSGCAGTTTTTSTVVHGSTTFDLPLASDAVGSLASGLGLSVSIADGVDRVVEVDTGSRGFVVARAAIGPRAADTGRKGFVEYTSDGLILSGEYFLAPITFHTAHSTVSTIAVRVLGVESSRCDPAYPHCVPESNIDHVGVLGVGYGEYAKTDGSPTTEVNPFLELTAMQDGRALRAYVITRNGITLGVTTAQLASFRQVALQKTAGQDLPGAWNPAQGCFALPDFGNEPRCGTVLVDTGIGTMIVGLDATLRPPVLANGIPNGTRIRIGLPAFTSAAMSYAVSVGSASDPLAPQGNPAARWSISGPFVNTGRHLLAGYDYLFDADTGHIGFRRDPS
jgi:hypothetical protein